MLKEIVERFREWIKLDELFDKGYEQTLYRIHVVLTIFKGVGGDKTETVNEIRSIPNVTTVTLEEELSDQPSFFRGNYSIKVAFERGEDLKDYIRKIFKPEIKRIEGLRINFIKNIEKIETKHGWQK